MAAQETRSGLRRLLFASRLRGSSSVDELSSTAFPSWTPSNNNNMKAVEEPACLSVGTDVSAKYRGAFCEAKIKTVKRLVKVKVTLKAEGTSQVVHDDQVKGTLRVGSVVEVKTSEGGSSEAVISKLTDASLYTVVFDDGDEKTLRRTSLCLKGERHFAESETLDQLPLTNPEHFGTPVIGKKSNRGRRSSQAVADEENESSSSDEEEEERRVCDELLGKVCSMEGQEPNLVLVVSPACSEELAVKKDHCLVRSFGDGKFSTLLRRNLNPLGSASTWKPELSESKGAEAAQSFLKSGAVPEVWKMDLSQILESSSDSDEKHSEEEPENEEDLKKKPTADSEPEEEADPEERDHFLQQLYKFMEDRGTPINKPPVLGYKDLNLFKLFRLVIQHGGYSGIESGTVWKQIYMDLGIPVLNSAAAYNVKTAYRKYLFGFEEYCRSALITFRTIHHNDPRPPASPSNQRPTPEIKTGFPANHRSTAEQKGSPLSNQRAVGVNLKDVIKMEPDAESESDSDREREEFLTSPRGRRRCVAPLKDEQREARKRTPRQNDQSERTPKLNDQSEHPPRLNDQLERGSKVTDQSERGSEDEEEDEEEEEEMPLLNSTERCDSDPESDSLAGTRVRVKYGRGKTQKIYEAHIKKTDNDNGENFYLVHYFGWNVRYDEWVKADRIIWPNEKGSKKKRRGKLKNKDEPEGDEECPPKEERPPKGPGRRGRPLGSKNKPNGRSVERREPGAAIANGDNTPRRRTRRTSGMFDSDRASNEDSGNSSDDSESEDSTDKKSFPWRQAEPGLKQEVELSPKQEEEVPETIPPAETTAPSMPQDISPSQSQQRVEPDPAVTPEQKDMAPVCEASPKLKLPLMPPRSEPMVLLHHCLPPDSDTDSASESDSEREDTTEVPKLDISQHKTEDTKEDRKNERTEEECVTNAKSPVRERNANTRSPNARSSNTQSYNTRSPSTRSPNARSPHKDRNLVEKSPLKLGVRSPLRDKHPGESEVVKSQLQQDKSLEEKCLTPQPVLVQNTPNTEISKEERTPVKQDTTPPENSPKQDSVQLENSPKRDGHQLENSPKRERIQPEMYPKRERIQPENSPRLDRVQPENSPRRDRVQPENSPRRDRVQPENSPRRDRVQPETSPRRDRVQPETSPRRDRVQPENSPRRDRVQPENSPRRDRVQPENSPRRDRVQPESSPRRDRVQPESSPRRDRVQPESSPRRDRVQPESSPRQDRALPANSPKRDPILLENSTKLGESEEQSQEMVERSEGNSTLLKRKASEQKTPDKKLKTDVEVSPKTTNMVTVEDKEKPAEDLSAKAEDTCEKSAESENVPEMGVDALVCHEVDLDEPDEREKVSASEQLIMMRESHLLRAPPMPVKGLTSPAKAPPPQVMPELNCTEMRERETQRGHERGGVRHEETNASPTTNGERGQKRVLEGPHSPTVKKHKRPSHKRLTPHKPDKNGAGHSSDSEDQSRVSLKTHKHCPSPTSRGHKWTLHIDDLEKMSSAERISFLQEKLQEIRKYYLSLKSEVASIDRRRKRLKKKEREVSNTASASSSSDAAMSPSSSSPSQSSLAVEVR